MAVRAGERARSLVLTNSQRAVCRGTQAEDLSHPNALFLVASIPLAKAERKSLD